VERQALDPPRLRIDLRETPCRIVLSYAGAYQLTLDSAAPELGIELHSVYAGQRLAGFAATSHLAVVRGRAPRVYLAPTGTEDPPVGAHRRDCLLHHLDQFSMLVAGETGGAVIIDITQAALDRMDDASASPSIPPKDPAGAGH
jgi:hypothetical protein